MKNMMKRITVGGLTMAVCALCIFLQAVPAVAATVTDCQALIANLRLETQAVTIVSKNADNIRAGLLAKVDRAALKLDQAKFLDAIQALNDYKALVNEAVNPKGNSSSPAITAADGATLTSGADDAIACIRSLCGC